MLVPGIEHNNEKLHTKPVLPLICAATCCTYMASVLCKPYAVYLTVTLGESQA